MELIIVESPTKAKTFGKILDKKEYEITSSMGHIRDLPSSKLSIDIEHDFTPNYQIIPKKKELVNKLVEMAKKADKVILATDPDREGEAIAFHLENILREKLKKEFKYSRIVFHEITKEALFAALAEPKQIDQELVDSQQARRILDRLVGYKVSPFLWKSFSKRWLSAGRVQSVALRLLVEREKERRAFSQSNYFVIHGIFADEKQELEAKLTELLGEAFYTSKKLTLFDGSYQYQSSILKTESEKQTQENRLQNQKYIIKDIEETENKRSPSSPFTTSTLQQFGANYLSFSAKKTMQVAQSLYEEGLITYHRTDSLNMSEKFIAEARVFIQKKYGTKYLALTERRFKTKSKLAQEAHEAIRPTSVQNEPGSEKIKTKLSRDQLRLYSAIYERSVATQMTEARIKKQKIMLSSLESKPDLFLAEAEKILFPGFLILSPKKLEEETMLHNLKKGDTVKLKQLLIEEKQTLPPPLYTEASLIKTLEEKGIGRPSTYAPIISLILERQYVTKDGRNLTPSELGIQVSDLLTKKFSELLAMDYTAAMEDELDEIAEHKKKWVTVVKEFYKPLSKQIDEAMETIEKIKVEEATGELCPECKKPLVIKLSRFGKFYACSGFPDCRYTKSFLQKTGVICPKCGKGDVVVRFSKKKRRFYACDRYPECDYTSLWLNKKETQA